VTGEDRPHGDDLLGLVADERLLDAGPSALPVAVGRPQPIPRRAERGGIVAVGVTMTTVTLIGGVIAMIAGAGELLFGDGGTLAIVLLLVGLLLAATHWGWAHVAELSATGLEQRRNTGVISERSAWLHQIAPFTRYEVTTIAGDDGSITIERVRHRPIRCNERTFAFERTVEHSEAHSDEEPAAVISERAEILRRQAAADTERERERFQAGADALQTAALAASDDTERRRAQAAAARALSEQINANLREPPLIE
jgi:hypothetical protein